MATTVPHHALSNSPMSRLPPELLERILLEAVTDTLPSHTVSDLHRTMRCKRELQSGEYLATQTLRFRLVCRRFRRRGWKAFGAVIETTIFDICSRTSIEHLRSIAKTSQLVPWVHALTLTCNAVDRNTSIHWPHRPSDLELGTEFWEEMDRTQLVEDDWYPELFLSPFKIDGTPQLDPPALDAFVQSLGDIFQQFHNLTKLTYLWDSSLLPQRYKSICCRIPAKQDPSRPRRKRSDTRSGPMGLQIVLEALAGTTIRPRILDLAVQLSDAHVFRSNVPSDTLMKVSCRTESLTLRGRCYSTHPGHWPSIQHTITKDLFPELRSFTYEGVQLRFQTSVPFPPQASIPDLSHIGVINAAFGGGSMIPFLEHYGMRLESLFLTDGRPQPYYLLFETILSLKLKQLVLRRDMEYLDKYWNEHWMLLFPRTSFTSLAEEVFIELPLLREQEEATADLILPAQ